MKRRLLRLANRFLQWCRRKSAGDVIRDQATVIKHLSDRIRDMEESAAMRAARQSFGVMMDEMVEATRMAGAGPWKVSPATLAVVNRVGEAAAGGDATHLREALKALKETNPTLLAGAFGDIELALQNVEWKREVQLGWLEFSRWGIQQIMLISRLYYIKNPIVRRLIDVNAAYVFARGVEISTGDDDANEVIKDFLHANKQVLGHAALVDLERQKDYDGNLFFALFADTKDKGKVSVRTIDALEIQDIVCNPDDSSEPWLYRRIWTAYTFNYDTGQGSGDTKEEWYPALGYNPPEGQRKKTVNGKPINWDTPIYHRRCGHISKWRFGCPRVYPMLDWAKEARRFLEACASIRQALSQIALTFTTKGGQQALEGAKTQLQTQVGPAAPIWDTNPPAVAGGVFASGPGTKLEAFKTQGAGFDPEGVRQYKLMCCMVAGVPETFLADVSTGNLATATTLDRPTETIFMEKQEQWVEDLAALVEYALTVSMKAPSGRLSESLRKAGVEVEKVTIRECERDRAAHKYLEEKKTAKKEDIRIQVNFPAIREGDIPNLVNAVVAALTLGNKSGTAVGIDLKAACRLLYQYLGVENGDEILEEQFPEADYDPDRTEEDEPEPPPPAPAPAPAPAADPDAPPPTPAKETRVRPALQRLHRALEGVLARNGH